VPLFGEVQCRVGEVEVRRPLRPVGETGDADRAEDRLELAAVVCLGGVVRDALRVDDADGAPLASCTQVQVILVELAQELPVVSIEPGLELLVGETGGL
jgi:hypothetical protein